MRFWVVGRLILLVNSPFITATTTNPFIFVMLALIITLFNPATTLLIL